MLKKWTAFLLTTVIVMALCPAMAMAETENNWNMEVWSEPNQPDGFTITPGEGATVTCDETNILGNTSKKIKISHPEDTATAETETTVKFKVLHEKDSKMSAGYYISFYLESLETDETRETDVGVQFSLVPQPRWEEQKTEFFTDITYEEWRKMMTYTWGDVYGGEGEEPVLTVTFKGVGVVYLDNFEVEITTHVLNGEFEGLMGDGKLAGGYYDDTAANHTKFWGTKFKTIRAEDLSKETEKGLYFVEAKDDNYLLAVNMGKTANECIDFHSMQDPDLVEGKSYRVTISNKSSNMNNGCGFMAWTGYDLPTEGISTRGIWTSPTTEWEDKSALFLYKYGKTQNQIAITFNGYNATTTSDTNPFCYFDNLRLEEVTEKVVLKNEDGEIIPSLIPGKPFKVYYEAPLFDKDKDTFDNAKVDGYTTEKKITAVAVLYKLEDGVKTVEDLELIPNLAGKSDNGADWWNSPPETNEIGFRPAQYEFNFDSLPETGEYTVKVFAWNDLAGLTPFSVSSYSFSTASK